MSDADYSIAVETHQDHTTVSFLTSTGFEGNQWATSTASPQICGRTHETLQLLKAYQQVVMSNRYIIMMIHGVSGVGKTALVESLRETVCDSHGFFCSGKFFQNSDVHEPYSAIMMAFSDLCDLVSQSDDFDDKRRHEIQEALGSDCAILSKVITNLSSVILDAAASADADGGVQHVIDPKSDVAYRKFKSACAHFLQAMSNQNHPIVLFIDDVQWMDEGSMHLINTLLDDADLTNIMLILTYRDEEADKVDALMLPDQASGRVIDLQIESLDHTAIYQILSSMTGSNSPETHELSDLLWQKTAGNPFYVLQLVNHLQKEGLLCQTFTATRSMWTFDVDEIRKRVQVSDNVANLLEIKAARLEPSVRDMLEVASLVGFRFDEETLLGVCAAPGLDTTPCDVNDKATSSTACSGSVVTSLSTAIELGLLEKVSDGYQFCHDKIQSCFQSMISDDKRIRLHKLIGDWFLFQGDAESLYHATNHLNKTFETPRSKGDYLSLVKLNLGASKYCRDRSAFIDEVGFLRRAHGALDVDTSRFKYPDLMFEITLSLAKVELIIGNVDRCEALTRNALLCCNDARQRVALLLVTLDRQMSSNDSNHALESIDHCLGMFGVKVPRRITIVHVLMKIFRVKAMMRNKTESTVLALPVLQGDFQNAAAKLLYEGSVIHALRNEVSESIFLSLFNVELSLKYGLSRWSSPAFAMYAYVMNISAMEKRGYAYSIGNLALAMADLVGCKEAKCATLVLSTCLVSHLRETVYSLKPSCDFATELAFETGFVQFAPFSCASSAAIRCFTGENLVHVESFHRSTSKRARELGQAPLVQWAMPFHQYTLNMLTHDSNWIDVLALNGEVMMECDFIKISLSARNEPMLFQFWLLKLNLAYHFRFFELADTFAAKVATYGDSSRGHFNVYQWYYLSSSVGYELYQSTGHRRHLRTAFRYHKALMKLKCSPNASPLLIILSAEKLASKRMSTYDCVTKAYTDAIYAMSESNWVHMEGLMNERLGFYLVRVDDHENAKLYFDRALVLYRDGWGSTAKCEWLREKVRL